MNIISSLNNYINRPKRIDFYNVFSQLHMLLTSGSTLQQALLDIAPYQEKVQLKNALKSISRSLATGLSPGAAFRKESIFPVIVAPTIEAGDKAGELSKAFNQLAEMMYLQHNLYSKINNALFVPKMSAVLMTLMTIGYIKIAIPEFLKLYEENEIEIPMLVSVVSGIVNALVDYWYLTLMAVYIFWKLWNWFTNSHVSLIDEWKLKIPIYSRLHYLFLQHQFASTISLMLASGLTVPEALIQSQKVVGNCHMADAVIRVRSSVMKGLSLTRSIQQQNSHKIFDAMLLASINAGERAGNISKSLESNCKYYERTLNNMIDPVSTKITLIVLIPMGVLIVAMYIFTMIPMFSYMGQVQ